FAKRRRPPCVDPLRPRRPPARSSIVAMRPMVYHEGSRIASVPMSPDQWPDLPHPLRPGHAYGVLEVRAGEITEEDRQDLDAEDLASMPQEGDIRHCLLARVDLRTGELFTEGYLSRDQYDWRIDTIL